MIELYEQGMEQLEHLLHTAVSVDREYKKPASSYVSHHIHDEILFLQPKPTKNDERYKARGDTTSAAHALLPVMLRCVAPRHLHRQQAVNVSTAGAAAVYFEERQQCCR